MGMILIERGGGNRSCDARQPGKIPAVNPCKVLHPTEEILKDEEGVTRFVNSCLFFR